MTNVVEIRGVRLDVTSPKISPTIRRGILEGWYEAEELDSVEKLMLDGTTIVEIGSGCGFTSAFIAKRFSRSRVICVEADPELIPIIRRNHELNGIAAEIYNEVLGRTSGEVEFYVHDDYWVSSLDSRDGFANGNKRPVRVPMSNFIDRLYEWRPQALLVDVEGGELELFSCSLPWFIDTIVVECHEWAYGLTGVKRLMDSLSQKGFAYVPSASVGAVLGYRRLVALDCPRCGENEGRNVPST